MEIDFKQFPMFTGIDKREMLAFDVAYSLANTLYTKVPDNIGAHCLSEKIYGENGKVDLDDKEINIIRNAYPLFTGAFADSFERYLKDYKEKEDKDETRES